MFRKRSESHPRRGERRQPLASLNYYWFKFTTDRFVPHPSKDTVPNPVRDTMYNGRRGCADVSHAYRVLRDETRRTQYPENQ
jgi:hypothetical protein